MTIVIRSQANIHAIETMTCVCCNVGTWRNHYVDALVSLGL
jgi:hypothetical protein